MLLVLDRLAFASDCRQNAYMGKKRRTPGEPEVPATESVEPVSRSVDRHDVRKMVAFDPDLYAALQILAKRNHRTIRHQVRHIMEAVLRRAGLWPPPADPS